MKRLLTILALLLFALPGHAEVRVTASKEYYPVSGLSKNQIMKNIRHQSPIKQDGRTFHAHTRSTMRYEFAWTRQNGRCSMKHATIFLDIIYKYPELSATPDQQTRVWWNAYLKRLEKHEQVHGNIAIEAAHDLDKTLNSLKELDCSTVKDVVKALGEAVMESSRNRQRAYDAVTEHGLKQDAYSAR
jgi:predicted secreted Zn-dependent protease